jgi:hypothetical protein
VASLLLIPFSAAAEICINEIDYDQPSTDTAEYIELKNNGPNPADLSEYSVELVNGTGGGASVYNTISSMTGMLGVGDYFVVCASEDDTPNCDLQALPPTNAIQNGAPDAIGLRHLGTLVDAVSYEGDTGAPYTETAGVVIGDDNASVDMGLARLPDGTDTDDNSLDFVFQENTPGASNGVNIAVPVMGPAALLMIGGALAIGGGWATRRRIR